MLNALRFFLGDRWPRHHVIIEYAYPGAFVARGQIARFGIRQLKNGRGMAKGTYNHLVGYILFGARFH